MENEKIEKIDASEFEFVQKDEKIHDLKFETKPIGFFKDALLRFSKNKASIVAGVVLLLVILFAIFGPFITKYPTSYTDANFKFCSPKSTALAWTGWDGTKTKDISKNDKKLYEQAYPKGTIISYKEKGEKYEAKLDTYRLAAGYNIISFTEAEKADLEKLIAADLKATSTKDDTWFAEDKIIAPYADSITNAAETKTKGYRANVYPTYKDKTGTTINQLYYDTTGTGFVTENTTEQSASNYASVYHNEATGVYYVRVNYYNYSTYLTGHEPQFLFGSNLSGQDLFGRLAIATRFSLILGVCVAAINILIGLLIGSLEGYYGGVVDLVVERIIEILVSIPSTVTASLFVFYIGSEHKILALVFVFLLTGWTGIASTVRSQFYRYKGQEYVLAARTLGANDGRIIFKHILPNAIGPIVTQAVLMVPSVIFTEATLAYLGIINLNSANTTSVGWLLNEAQSNFIAYPFVLLFPAGLVAILMIAFNIFGNGLRDAFNPSLRGSE